MNLRWPLFILFCFAAFTACKKKYSYEKGAITQPQPVPRPKPNTQVITTGFAIDNNTLERALYWKDSNFFYVEPSATEQLEATSSVMWNGQLIIAGQYWQIINN